MIKFAFEVIDTCLWYLDSGCSRHIIGDRSIFKVFESKKGGNVTFGDGSKSQIKGKGVISLPGLPDITNILYVEGLRVNMLSISQICDQDFMVLFLKGKCLVMDESGKKLISGVRTLDNYYGLVPDVDIMCNNIRLSNEDLWHQRMGHASYKHLSIVSKHESVLGIPKLTLQQNVFLVTKISEEIFFVTKNTALVTKYFVTVGITMDSISDENPFVTIKKN